jgi:hypothetical protein
MLAVDKYGVVGIAWFDARNAVGAQGYDVYFTASVDGGESFLPAVRISSMTSRPRDGKETNPLSSDQGFNNFFSGTSSLKDDKTIMFASPYTLRWTGGDYSTMTVDAAARFHPLWPDARDGTWQLYTSTIHVLPQNSARQFDYLGSKAVRSCALGRRLRLNLGVALWDADTKNVSVPVQIENMSNETLLHPLSVQITKMDDPDLTRWGAAVASELPPALAYDTESGRYRASANMIYPVSSERPLFPDGVTVPMLWRFHVTGPEQINFTSRVTITGISTSCHS